MTGTALEQRLTETDNYDVLREIEQRKLRVHVVETRKPSPFASSLLFSYVANFLYDGDAPLAERRAQALTIDQDQLRELLGTCDCLFVTEDLPLSRSAP